MYSRINKRKAFIKIIVMVEIGKQIEHLALGASELAGPLTIFMRHCGFIDMFM